MKFDPIKYIKFIKPFKYNSVEVSKVDIVKVLTPEIQLTQFKWTPLPSIYSNEIDPSRKSREIKLMNALKKMNPGCPVLRSKSYPNAFHVSNLKELLDSMNATDYDIEMLCNEWGVDVNEFKKNLGSHMVILGDKFANAPVLAHEFGHYRSTIGLEGKLPKKYHDKYPIDSKKSESMKNIVDLITKIYITYASVIIGAYLITGLLARLLGRCLVLGLDITSLVSLITNELSIKYGSTIIKAESEATKSALKMLTECGCTEDELKVYSTSLSGALDTYISHYKKSKVKFRWINLVNLAAGIILTTIAFSKVESIKYNEDIKLFTYES